MKEPLVSGFSKQSVIEPAGYKIANKKPTSSSAGLGLRFYLDTYGSIPRFSENLGYIREPVFGL
jgi:hypothetical protein